MKYLQTKNLGAEAREDPVHLLLIALNGSRVEMQDACYNDSYTCHSPFNFTLLICHQGSRSQCYLDQSHVIVNTE